MNRVDLERLDREALIRRAEEAGVTRARILTRPELVDELLLRSTADQATKDRARGMFGLARDLVARVVERGLHLPDAAERIRTLGATPPAPRSAPAALPTVTLAEIYAAQGHRHRAVETLQGVLVREPDHAAARALLGQLDDDTFPVPPPRMLPEDDDEALSAAGLRGDSEPSDALDEDAGDELADSDEPPDTIEAVAGPARADVDECVAIRVDPQTVYLYWQVRERTLGSLRAARPAGRATLRTVTVVPTWDGPRSTVRDSDVSATLGDCVVRDLPAGSVVRVAIGWREGDVFLPIAHSPALETPPGSTSPLEARLLVRWTPRGMFHVTAADRDAASIDRALEHFAAS